MKTLFTILLGCFCLLTAAQAVPVREHAYHDATSVQQLEEYVHHISDAEFVEQNELEPVPQACDTHAELLTVLPEMVTPYHHHGEFLFARLPIAERYILVRSLLI